VVKNFILVARPIIDIINGNPRVNKVRIKQVEIFDDRFGI